MVRNHLFRFTVLRTYCRGSPLRMSQIFNFLVNGVRSNTGYWLLRIVRCLGSRLFRICYDVTDSAPKAFKTLRVHNIAVRFGGVFPRPQPSHLPPTRAGSLTRPPFYSLSLSLFSRDSIIGCVRSSVRRSVGPSVRRSLFTTHATYGDRPCYIPKPRGKPPTGTAPYV